MVRDFDTCPVCRDLLDEEDLFCGNCGTEVEGEGSPPATQTVVHAFTCRGCGASMSYSAAAQALRCPFCGAEELDAEPPRREVAPAGVAEFAIDREQAVRRLREWLGRGMWRPGDLARAAVIDHMQPVFLPYWSFSAETLTHYTADSSRTPAGARGDWVPVSGTRRGSWHGLLVPASSVLTPGEVNSLGRYDLSSLRPPEAIEVGNAAMEAFRLSRRAARPRGRSGLEGLERVECVALVPGRVRNLRVNVLVEGMRSEPICLPVWICAYTYRQERFRYLVNGQTGHVSGAAPVSWLKIGGAIAAAVVLLLLLLAILATVMLMQ